MKIIATWLVVTLAAFGALAGGYHVSLDGNPRRVLVVIDSSFEMQPVWRKVPALLDRLDDAPYSRYGLATEKSRVHGWRRSLTLGTTVPYAPRDFDKLAAGAGFPEIGEADQVYLVTNAPESTLDEFSDWTVLRP